MKFTCILSYFLQALSVVERVTGKNATLPILQNVHIHAERGRIVLSSTNLEVAIRVSFQAKITTDGQFTVPARTLLNFLTYADGEKLSVQVRGLVLALEIDQGAHKASLNGLDAKDFPIIPSVGGGTSISLPATQFFRALSSVSFLAASSDVRPELAGVFCSFDGGGQVRIAATDSFRLGECLLAIPTAKEKTQCIIPSRTVGEVVRALADSSDELTIVLGPNQILFKTAERELISRLVEGKYPDYTAILPTSFATKAHLRRETFVQALRASSVFSGKTQDVRIRFSPKEKLCVVESRNADVGEHVKELVCEGDGKDLVIVGNYQYFLDALSKIEDDTVSIEGNKEADPVLLKGLTTTSARYLIMPLRSTY